MKGLRRWLHLVLGLCSFAGWLVAESTGPQMYVHPIKVLVWSFMGRIAELVSDRHQLAHKNGPLALERPYIA